jgi:hypothetical protein
MVTSTLPARVSTPFPPTNEVIIGDGTITIDQWLANPLRVTNTLRDLSLERFLADDILAPGGRATGGAVIYDQVLANDLYALRDVQAIEPGAEFPIVTGTAVNPLTARTVKWGGAFIITYEDRDRNATDVLATELTRLTNTIIKKVDSVAIATLRAAPLNEALAAAPWADPDARIFEDVAGVVSQVDEQDLGYTIDTAIISPANALAMLTNERLQNLLPREAGNVGLIGRLSGLAGITRWRQSNRVGNDEIIFTSGRQAGSISDERPLYSRTVDQPEQERILVQAARLCVPYITNPKSAVRLRGVGA